MQSRLLPGPSVCFTGQHWPAKGLQEDTKDDVTAYRWERCYTVQPRRRFHIISTCAEPIIAAVTCGNGDVADMPWMMMIMMMMMMLMYVSYKSWRTRRRRQNWTDGSSLLSRLQHTDQQTTVNRNRNRKNNL